MHFILCWLEFHHQNCSNSKCNNSLETLTFWQAASCIINKLINDENKLHFTAFSTVTVLTTCQERFFEITHVIHCSNNVSSVVYLS